MRREARAGKRGGKVGHEPRARAERAGRRGRQVRAWRERVPHSPPALPAPPTRLCPPRGSGSGCLAAPEAAPSFRCGGVLGPAAAACAAVMSVPAFIDITEEDQVRCRGAARRSCGQARGGREGSEKREGSRLPAAGPSAAGAGPQAGRRLRPWEALSCRGCRAPRPAAQLGWEEAR